METMFEQRFDPRRKFQYVNDEPSVLHCHHYITMCSQLAMEKENLEGPRLIMEAMEETFYLVLKKYFIRYGITRQQDMIKTAEEYFSLTGMGILSIQPGKDTGSAEMKRSHIDEGWIRKWGTSEKGVNFAGCGYIAAVFALVNEVPLRSYDVREVQSIASGADSSKFTVELKKEKA